MNILIIGNGGREHALAWKAVQSKHVDQVFVAPGNAGTAREAGVQNINIPADDIPMLMHFAKQQHIDLTIVGPEAPLVLGVVDAFEKEGLNILGPSQACAQLEGSKTFCKNFLKEYHIPTAAYDSFTDTQKAIAYLQTQSFPIVIKADGLAAGKGVIIAQDLEHAIATVKDMLDTNRFGSAGSRVVIEAFLTGEEVSFIVLCDGTHVMPFATSQDHKARDNGDKGPNTGGMGAYSPAPRVTPALHDRIMREIIMPTVEGMKARGTPYKGFLYAGLMISPEGEPNVLEYNCRFGDPETQPIMMRLESDLIEHCLAAVQGTLDKQTARWDKGFAIGVVMASGGYPESYHSGDLISGLDQVNAGVKVFHAGTRLENEHVVTHGGRVLCVTTTSNTLKEAQTKAYDQIKHIHWNNAYFRTDIGFKAL